MTDPKRPATPLAPSEGEARRAGLLRLVRAHPGIHLRELQRQMACGWGTLTYHLDVLLRQGEVAIGRNGRHVLVWVPGAEPPPLPERLHARGAAAKIYALVGSRSEVLQRDVQEALGLSRQLVAHHLRALVADGLIVIVGGHPKRYQVAAFSSLPPSAGPVDPGREDVAASSGSVRI